jgi:GAF domain-containing protein
VIEAITALPLSAPASDREAHYREVSAQIWSVLDEEDDWVAAMATSAAILHGAFDYFDWTGFYRPLRERELVIGPYQGGSACLRIAFDRGVCGAAARTLQTQLVADVNAFPGHIACAASTRSEIVVPVVTPGGALLAVLDVDSNSPAAFTDVDQRALEAVCEELGRRYRAPSR